MLSHSPHYWSHLPWVEHSPPSDNSHTCNNLSSHPEELRTGCWEVQLEATLKNKPKRKPPGKGGSLLVLRLQLTGYWAQCWKKLALVHSLLLFAHTQAQQRELQDVDCWWIWTGCPGPVTGSTKHRSEWESLQLYLINRNRLKEAAKKGQQQKKTGPKGKNKRILHKKN